MNFKLEIQNYLEQLEQKHIQTKENENDKETNRGIIVESTGLGETIGNEINNCSNWQTPAKLIKKRKTDGQNQKNKIKTPMFSRKTRFIGVFRHKIKNLFQVRFTPRGHRKCIDGGIYDDIHKATRAYDLLKKKPRQYITNKKKVDTNTYKCVYQNRSGAYYGQIYHRRKRYMTRPYENKLHAAQAVNWKCQQLGKRLMNPAVSCVDRDAESAEIAGDRENSIKKSKFVGVYWLQPGKKWKTQINFQGKVHYTGCYETELEAAEAVNSKCLELGRPILNPQLSVTDLLFKSLPPRFEKYRNIFITEMVDFEDIPFITQNVLVEWGIVNQLDVNKVFRMLKRLQQKKKKCI